MTSTERCGTKGLLTPKRCWALATISRRGPSTSAELAEIGGFRIKSSLTRLLSGLVDVGLLEAERIEPCHERRYSLTAEANRVGYRDRSRA